MDLVLINNKMSSITVKTSVFVFTGDTEYCYCCCCVN